MNPQTLTDLTARLEQAQRHPQVPHQRVRWLEQLAGLLAYELWRAAAPVDAFDDARWTV